MRIIGRGFSQVIVVQFVLGLLFIVAPSLACGQELMYPTNEDDLPWVILSPSIMLGPTLINHPSSSTSKAGLGYSANFGVDIFSSRDARNSIAIGIGYDSRSRVFSVNESDARVRANYLTVFPAFNFWQVATIGVNVGIPLSTRVSVSDASGSSDIKLGQLNALIEPKVMLAIPLALYNEGRSGIIGWLSFAYPLTTLSDQILQLKNITLAPFSLIEFGAGLGFSFDILHQSDEGIHSQYPM